MQPVGQLRSKQTTALLLQVLARSTRRTTCRRQLLVSSRVSTQPLCPTPWNGQKLEKVGFVIEQVFQDACNEYQNACNPVAYDVTSKLTFIYRVN
jgi:hypothetical protein